MLTQKKRYKISFQRCNDWRMKCNAFLLHRAVAVPFARWLIVFSLPRNTNSIAAMWAVNDTVTSSAITIVRCTALTKKKELGSNDPRSFRSTLLFCLWSVCSWIFGSFSQIMNAAAISFTKPLLLKAIITPCLNKIIIINNKPKTNSIDQIDCTPRPVPLCFCTLPARQSTCQKLWERRLPATSGHKSAAAAARESIGY